MMNKKGFTLVELVGAILLLGIILTIATASVVNQMNKNKRKIVLKSAQSYVTAINDNNFINDPDKIISSVTVNSTTKEVSAATLYIKGYKITYNGTKYTITSE